VVLDEERRGWGQEKTRELPREARVFQLANLVPARLWSETLNSLMCLLKDWAMQERGEGKKFFLPLHPSRVRENRRSRGPLGAFKPVG